MQTDELKATALKALDDLKGLDIVEYDVREESVESICAALRHV